MTLVLATESNPGSSNWVDVSTIGGGWGLFPDPGDGGTLNVGSSSGECVAIVGSGVTTTTVAPPLVLGQMLALSSSASPPPAGPVPMGPPSDYRLFAFNNPVDTFGSTAILVPKSTIAINGCSALLIAAFVSLNNNAPVLMWRAVRLDGTTTPP